jgi:hypothetical protein
MQRNVVIYKPLSPVWKGWLLRVFFYHNLLYSAQFCNRGYYFAASTADQTVSLWATDRIKPLRIFADNDGDMTEIVSRNN